MSIIVELLESNSQIKKNMYKALVPELNKMINKRINTAKNAFKRSVDIWVREQDEVGSLLSEGIISTLNAQFGLPPGAAPVAVDSIISSIIDSIDVDIKPVNSRLVGEVNFNIQPANLTNLLGLDAGYQPTKRGGNLHWMDWLLMQGASAIVTGYNYKPEFGGRSGGGIMEFGNVWRVPGEFAGTQDDNFITRAFLNREKQVESILREIFK